MEKGGFWFTLGSTLTPSFNAYGAYAADPNQPTQGLTSPGFHASFGKKIQTSPFLLPTLIGNNNNNRLLPPLHGPHESNLPHLRTPDKYRLRSHLPRTTAYFCCPNRLVLAAGTGKHRNGPEITGCGRRLWISGDPGRMVDFFCSNARFCRLSISDSCGRYQSFNHSLERACQAKGTLPSLSFVSSPSLSLLGCESQLEQGQSDAKGSGIAIRNLLVVAVVKI